MNYGIATQTQGSIYPGQSGGVPIVSPPRTIASALGRVDGVNERLSKVRAHLNEIADAIGGPRPADEPANNVKLPSAGAVGRLNDSVEGAHDFLSEIEGLLGSISRALG